jgi:5-formyltetrahydrofolate cyclo-ligase
VLEDTKEAIRKRVLEKRRMVPEVEKKYKSEIIIERLFMQEGYKKSKFVMCYVDFDGEVETRDFILRCIADGKRLAVPMVTKDVSGTRIVIASEVFDPGKDLEKGCFGIHEPKKGAVREINPCEIDLVTVPGVAFDFNKNRIGYGAGLYDRFLKKTANTCFKAGIAFEFQIYENIPAGIYDIPMDIIITEGRLI